MLNNLSFLGPGEHWPPKDRDTQKRLKLYEENAALFEGEHEEVFKDWVRLLREDKKAVLQIILNWPKRLSTLWADVLLGEPPEISSEKEQSDTFLRQLNEDNRLIETGYEVAIDVSRFGVGIFKTRRKNGKSIIEGLYPGLWFPVVSRDNIREYEAHVIGWIFKQDDIKYLRIEIHRVGEIEHLVYKMEGSYIRSRMDLKEFYPELQEKEPTGVEDFLIKPVHGLRTTEKLTGMDDYSDLDSIIQELEMRIAQISRILDKHADPNMYGPSSALDYDEETGESQFRGGGKFFPLESKEDATPGYLTWGGQLEAAFKQIDYLMEQFYILSETSPAAFGQLKNGLAESGSALRRLMLAPLLKADRIRTRFEPGFKGIIRTAAELQGVDLETLTVEWKDGLPEDDKEQTETEVQRYSGGLTSLRSSLRRLYGLKGEALENEVKAIMDEQGMSVNNNPLQAGTQV
jgi:hypothetical protein